MDTTEALSMICIKFMLSVLVLVVVSNEGNAMPTCFFLQDLRVNILAYIKVPHTGIKLWIKVVARCIPTFHCSLSYMAHNWQPDNLMSCQLQYMAS